MDFSNYLKRLREKNKLSIRQLALYSDVSAGYLSQIESGIRGIPSPEVIKKLHKPLKVEYEDLMRAAGYLEENGQPSSEEDELDQQVREMMNDPETGVFFKDYLSAPEEKKKQLREFMRFLLIEEKGRKPGDKQGE
jgi:transcriptional regulator with XRE-family HTH domain